MYIDIYIYTHTGNNHELMSFTYEKKVKKCFLFVLKQRMFYTVSVLQSRFDNTNVT